MLGHVCSAVREGGEGVRLCDLSASPRAQETPVGGASGTLHSSCVLSGPHTGPAGGWAQSLSQELRGSGRDGPCSLIWPWAGHG